MKVLIADKISESVFDLFGNNNIDSDYQPEITPAKLLQIIPQYQALIVRSRTKVTKEIIEKGSKLLIIGRVGSGVDNIAIEEARNRKITVVNAPEANTEAVAEHVIGLIISLLRKYPLAFSSTSQGQWLKNQLSGAELLGKTVGIVGYGHIGKRLEKLVQSFGANTLIFSRSFQTCSLKELFARSDIVSLHLALTKETAGMINRDLLALLKPSAYLVNTSRGEIIVEEDLIKILKEKKIAGAALDVFAKEPIPSDSALFSLDNLILTPHIAASTKEALEKASRSVAEDVIRVLQGTKAKNIVN